MPKTSFFFKNIVVKKIITRIIKVMSQLDLSHKLYKILTYVVNCKLKTMF